MSIETLIPYPSSEISRHIDKSSKSAYNSSTKYLFLTFPRIYIQSCPYPNAIGLPPESPPSRVPEFYTPAD